MPDRILASPQCLNLHQELQFDSRVATAGFWANYRNHEGSINHEMDDMLNAADHQVEVIMKQTRCKDSCKDGALTLVFRSAPLKILQEYEDFQYCAQLEHRTITNPIVYANRRFKSRDAAKEWYSSLTQGKGPDGKDLYRQCDRNCSPSYTTLVTKHDDHFVLTSKIICGHARNKDDNQYRLSSSFIWSCHQNN